MTIYLLWRDAHGLADNFYVFKIFLQKCIAEKSMKSYQKRKVYKDWYYFIEEREVIE